MPLPHDDTSPQDSGLPTLELVRAAQSGSTEALETLVLRYLPSLRAYVRLKAGPALRQHESANDLVQSTCREVCTSLEQTAFADEAGFRGWLFTLAWNKIASRHRRAMAERRDPSRERGSVDLDSQLAEELYAPTQSPSSAADLREEMARLEAAFDRLPEDYREVLTLARFAELPHRHIAARLGRTEVATRKMLQRATARLATEMRREGQAPPGGQR